ncbi:hypothetical protein EV426DRAFT_591587, partial [Tirmania nivea]
MNMYLGIFLVLTARCITTVAGIKCSSYCAACWKDGEPGVDIKFHLDHQKAADWCPPGYHGIHCAKAARCVCDYPKKASECKIFGPCICPAKYSEVNGSLYCPSPIECGL